MRVATALAVAVLAGAALLTGLAEGVRTPRPTVDFYRGQLPEEKSFHASPVTDRGRDFLLKTSYAVLGAPQWNWIVLRRLSDYEPLTAAEFEYRWSLFLRSWERTLTIYFYPHATALKDAYAGGTGYLTQFLLETSTGYRAAISGDDLPRRTPDFKYELTPPRFENKYPLKFDRPAALAPGTEWIRLYVVTTDGASMYFEWRF